MSEGTAIASIDTLNTFEGWKTIFSAKDSWIQYNGVDFGKGKFKTISIRAVSKTGGNLQLRLNGKNGTIIAKSAIPSGEKWEIIKAPVSGLKSGVQNLIVSSTDNNLVEVDWIRFE
jgi:hypothetical protein